MLNLSIAQDIKLEHALWQGISKKRPLTYAHLVINEDGLEVKFSVEELAPPLISVKEQGDGIKMVCQDSAVELFLAFALDETSSLKHSFKPNLGECLYLNLEFNALGVCYAKYGQYRENRIAFSLEQIKKLNIKAHIDNNKWTLSFIVPHDLIYSIVHYNAFTSGHCFAFNAYKIAEDKEHEHYLAYSPIDEQQISTPNFHLPQYFALAYVA